MQISPGCDHAGYPLDAPKAFLVENGHAVLLATGGRIVAPHPAKEIVTLRRVAPFGGGRHVARLEQVHQIERGER